MRTILVGIFLFFFFLISMPIMVIEWLIHRFNPEKSDLRQLRFVQWAFKVIIFISGCKVTVKGMENIPDNQACVFMGNHRGFFDVIITYSLFKGRTGFVAKDSFKKVPLLRVWMSRLHCLFLNRSDIRAGLKTILEGIELLKNGVSMVIYPEGTRSRSDNQKELLPFHDGSMKLSTKSNCPIVPMAITNTSAVFEEHLPWIKKQNVTLIFGEPIYPDKLSKEELKTLSSFTRERILSLMDEALK